MSSRKILQQIISRQLSTTARRSADEIHPGYHKLFAKQEHFQKEDGKPVHLKGGGMDGVLYRLTVILCAVGLISNFSLYYKLATK